MDPENTNDDQSDDEDTYSSTGSFDSDYEPPNDWDGSGTAQHLPVGSVELWDACRAGQAHTVRQLLRVEGIDIEMGCHGTTPLLAAVTAGATEVVELLLREGANASFITSIQGSTCLHTAITGGGVWFGRPLPPKFVDILKLLLAYNPDRSFVEAVGYKGPLMLPFAMAIGHDHIEVVKVLVKHGVDVNRVFCGGQLPISLAVRNGNFDMVRLLIANGADVTHRDLTGNTVLRCAAWRADPQIFELLIENGLDINAVDNEGRSALHWAGYLASIKMTKFLLSKPVVLELKSLTGKTPVEYARACLPDDCSDYMCYYPLDFDVDGRECEHHQIGLRDTVCQLMQSEIQRRAKCEAFAMGQHPRLGVGSRVADLYPDVMRVVFAHVV
jgi:ankyrin repeat protein